MTDPSTTPQTPEQRTEGSDALSSTTEVPTFVDVSETGGEASELPIEVAVAPTEFDEHVHVDQHQHAVLKVRLARLELLMGLGNTSAGTAGHHLPAWLRPTRGETRWQVTISVLAVVALQLWIPKELAFRPWYLLPIVEIALFLVLAFANPRRITRESKLLRFVALLLVGSASLAVAWSAAQLVAHLAKGTAGNDAVQLLLNGGAIWLTNVIVFALWYWEYDRGGPAARASARRKHPDFLFTQMTAPELVDRDWEPAFFDYLYLSFTNATAFSPTDTLPLSRWAKVSMMFQSGVSLITVALVVARAVNIFN